MKGRLLVVDDEHGILVALKGLFGKEGYEVETAESGEEALAKVKAGLFHVIITDLSMQGMSGLDLMRSVRQLDPECAVLMITAYGTQRIAVQAMKAGAVEFLTKPFSDDVLLSAIRQALERSCDALRRESEMRALRNRYAALTAREREVMALVVSGLLNKQVGSELGISEITVKAHRGRVMQKMKANSLADLVKMAARLQLVGAPASPTL